MPRIEDRLLKAVTYLYNSEDAQKVERLVAVDSWSGNRARFQMRCSRPR
jgi:hypothetical protein